MSSKNQTDTAHTDTPSTSDPSPWLWYKRHSDSKRVEARVFPVHRLMQVRVSKEEDFSCPCCKELLSKGNGGEFPDVFLPVTVFHERHRPLDDYKP